MDSACSRLVGREELMFTAPHVPAFGISCPGVMFLCGPKVNPRMLDSSVLTRDNAVSTLLFGGILKL